MKKWFKRKEKIKYPKTQPKPKKKLTCWQKCRRSLCRRCRIWLTRRIKRCFKRLIFGENGPIIERIKVNDFDWRKMIKKSSMNTPDESKKQSKKSLAIKDAIANEIDAYSLSKSIGGKVKSFADNFQDTYLNLDSKLNIFDTQKHRSKVDLAEKYKKNSKNSVVTLFRNKLKSTKSVAMKDALKTEKDTYASSRSFGKNIKPHIRNLREDNPYLGLADDSKLHLNAKDKEKYRKLAEKYEKKKIPYQEIALIENIDKLKEKLSLSPSKTAAIQRMEDDWKLGKFSFSKMPDMSKMKIDTFNKKDLNKILAHYESEKKNIHYPFKKQSKLKQLKSDLREKIETLKEKNYS